MLIPLDQIVQLYRKIVKDAVKCDGQGSTINILVSNDTDSLAALKILTTLLKQDEVQFVSIPVFSNNHIVSEILKMKGSTYLRSIVFLNCGGRLDLTDQWFAESEEVKSYLIDSYRPINHRNVNDQSEICVIHGGCKSFNECPTIEDARLYEELVENASDVSDEYDSEQSEEQHSDLEEAKQELEDLKEDDDDEEVLEDGLGNRSKPKEPEENDGVEPEAGSQGSQKVGEKRPASEDLVDTRKLKRQKKQLFMNYYGVGQYYGKSTAGMMYELCQ